MRSLSKLQKKNMLPFPQSPSNKVSGGNTGSTNSTSVSLPLSKKEKHFNMHSKGNREKAIQGLYYLINSFKNLVWFYI